MRRLGFVLVALLAVFVPGSALAGGDCKPLSITSSGAAFTAIDISGGAVTSDRFVVAWGAEVTLRIDLTDASNGVSNLRLTFREYSAPTGGTARTVADCDRAAGVWTCNQLKIDWNPTTSGNGKSYVMPLPVAYRYLDITVTPTGHGAGDTLTLGGEVCY